MRDGGTNTTPNHRKLPGQNDYKSDRKYILNDCAPNSNPDPNSNPNQNPNPSPDPDFAAINRKLNRLSAAVALLFVIEISRTVDGVGSAHPTLCAMNTHDQQTLP